MPYRAVLTLRKLLRGRFRIDVSCNGVTWDSIDDRTIFEPSGHAVHGSGQVIPAGGHVEARWVRPETVSVPLCTESGNCRVFPTSLRTPYAMSGTIRRRWE